MKGRYSRVVVTLCLLACGAPKPRTRVELDAVRVSYAQELAVKRRAPELWQKAEQALSAARNAQDSDTERSERLAEARLWLEAAIAECERADLVQKRLIEERKVDAMEAENARTTNELAALMDARDLELARALAKEEATRALERAATVPARRPKLDKADVAKSVDALVTRTRLLLVALSALGADPGERAPIEATLEEVERLRGKNPDLSLDLADRALFDALTRVGKRQTATTSPRPGDAEALRSLLEQAGLPVTRGDAGLIGVISDVPMGGNLPFAVTRKISRACAIASVHTVGPVRFVIASRENRARDVQRRELEKVLSEHGCVGQRFGVDLAKGKDGLSVAWISY